MKVGDLEHFKNMSFLAHSARGALRIFKNTVSSKLKSYSSVLLESCSAALEPRKIASAVREVAEGEDRSKNIIVFRVPEEQGENVDNKFNQLFENWTRNLIQQIVAESVSANLACPDQCVSRSRDQTLFIRS